MAPDRLRFDFTHYGPLSPEETARVEDLVNAQILADEDVHVDRDGQGRRRRRRGAIAFFDEKYGDEVRVVQAGSESLELCGGTHVARLGQIGPVEIVSEGSIGSNLRRIEATTGTVTLARLRQAERQISDASALLRARPDELTTAAAAQARRPQGARRPTAGGRAGGARWVRRAAWPSTAVDGWLVARVDGLGPDQLRQLANQVRQIGGLRTVVLGGSPDGSRAALVALAGQRRPG